MYFTQDHENAILDYCRTEDLEIKTQLYIEFIQPAFNEMVDKIVFTYRFTNLPNIDELRSECKFGSQPYWPNMTPTEDQKHSLIFRS